MGAGEDQRSFKIRIADEDEVTLVLDFHSQYLTEYLWPRTLEEFRKLAEDSSLLRSFRDL